MRIHPAVFAIVVLLALGMGLAGGLLLRSAPSSPSSAKPQGFVVRKAIWGADGKWVDVTKQIAPLVRGDAIYGINLALPEVAFGKHKRLTLDCEVDGAQVYFSSLDAGDPIYIGKSLPPDVPATIDAK